MRLNLTKPLVVFDLETTGLDFILDRIIQISYIKVFPDGHEERASHYVNPGKPIPKDVVALTGITDAEVAESPSFKELAPRFAETFAGCDFAGFNSNQFDIPMLAEEFIRAGVSFDFSSANLIDAQTIFHRMERRNLSAAYEFYCGRRMDEDFAAHRADQDAEATYRVLQGQLEMYSEARQSDEERRIQNDMAALAEFSKMNDNVDFAGRIVWKADKFPGGEPKLDPEGNPIKVEYFNFGKYKGRKVVDVLRSDPGYYSWMMGGDFPYTTKQVLTKIRMRLMHQGG